MCLLASLRRAVAQYDFMLLVMQGATWARDIGGVFRSAVLTEAEVRRVPGRPVVLLTCPLHKCSVCDRLLGPGSPALLPTTKPFNASTAARALGREV